MMRDDLKTNSANIILNAVRHCRKVFWYASTLQVYLEVTKHSIRNAMPKDTLKNKLFHLTWDEEVLFIREEDE